MPAAKATIFTVCLATHQSCGVRLHISVSGRKPDHPASAELVGYSEAPAGILAVDVLVGAARPAGEALQTVVIGKGSELYM